MKDKSLQLSAEEKTGNAKYSTIIIKKSKFISAYFLIDSESEVLAILEALKKEHKRASHICFAYVFENCDGAFEKCFDDGEPNGSGGAPILNIIKRSDKKNLLVVVIRYFGGIKLGVGGLIRAYANATKLALNP
ncbi:MAG: YigZ family protein [Clostridia bacterium]